MRFFTRCRILSKILIGIDIILGLFIVFQIPEIPDAFQLKGSTNDRILLWFSILCVMFIIILLLIIVLKCIVKDANEDIQALIHIKEQEI